MVYHNHLRPTDGVHFPEVQNGTCHPFWSQIRHPIPMYPCSSAPVCICFNFTLSTDTYYCSRLSSSPAPPLFAMSCSSSIPTMAWLLVSPSVYICFPFGRTHARFTLGVCRKVGMSPLLQFSGARNRFCMYIRIVPCLFSMSAQISRTPREREWSGREMPGKSCSSSDSPLDCHDAHHLGTQRKCRERRCRQPSLLLYPAICINRRGSSFI